MAAKVMGDARTADGLASAVETHGPNGGPRSRVRRHAERAAPEVIEEVLAAGRVAHVAFVAEGQPYVLPFTYHYADGALYLHGVPGGRAIRVLRGGMPVCVEVLLLDGLVASRAEKNHSMNYRSAVIFGRAEVVADLAEKRAIFGAMIARYFPGRAVGSDYAPASVKDLRGVELLRVRIEETSGKRRAGPALGPHDAETDHPSGSTFVLALPRVDG